MRIRLLPDIPEIGWTPYLWLVYVFFFFIDPLVRHTTPREWVVMALSMALFLYLYFRCYWEKGRGLLAVIASLVLLGAVLLPWNSGASVFYIYAAAAVGFLGPPRVAVRWLLAIVVVLLAEAWWFHTSRWGVVPGVVISLIVGAANIHFGEVSRNQRKLQLAREEVERLAKLAERERIARDLHDLLGHTLSVIALKAELAGRLLARDPAAAAAEIAEVQRVSRQALAEVRRAVEGYRERGLAAEVAGARQALRAAGVTLVVCAETMRLPAAVEGVLALALREAVTNVIRHARASNCRIALDPLDGEVQLEVSDDGCGGLAPEGVGLSGMRERAALLGGRLERLGEGGTTVRMILPLPKRVQDAPAAETVPPAEVAR